MGLNPFAQEFRPGALVALVNKPHLAAQPAPSHTITPEAIEIDATAVCKLEELPDEVLLDVLSRLHAARDVAVCMAACHRLSGLVARAPLALELGDRRSAATFQPEGQAKLAAATRWLARHCQGVTSLNLSNSPLEERQLSALLAQLPRLAALDLSGCKKLPPAVAALLFPPSGVAAPHDTELAAPAAPAVPVAGTAPEALRPLALASVNLQRCYQLTAAALSLALRAAAAPHSPLSCVALSHLNLSHWQYAPEHVVATANIEGGAGAVAEVVAEEGDQIGDDAQPAALARALPATLAPPLAGLRTLALHNCTRLSALGLQSLALACPGLRYILLGGCTFDVTDARPSAPALQPYAQGFAALCAVQLSLDDAWEGGGARAGGAVPALGRRRVVPTLGQRALAKQVAAALAMAVLELRAPAAVEVTFLPLGCAQALGDMLASGAYAALAPAGGARGSSSSAAAAGGGCGSNPQPAVWDMCDPACVAHAAEVAASAGAGDDVRLGAAAAANCSAVNRVTALHCAAERGDADTIRRLLSLRAAANVRDSSGCTPLFLACEAGRGAAVAALLDGGADACLNNTAGESPAYIAALRGHLPVVQHLLAHFQARGIAWQDTRLYGDGWSPLMAAAVADRVDVASCLLHASGGGAAALVHAQNRYGQNPLHIAARKGSPRLLQLLLAYSGRGAALLAAADASGETPVDIAARNKHAVAVALFQHYLCGSCEAA